jgi:inosine/xanthosine triphosphate pyrophosphatase family protein/ferredoxin
MNNPIFVYGTTNPAKLDHMRKMLAPLNANFIGAKETGIALPDVDESGNTPLENARIKDLAYYEVLKRPVFACDSGLYIDGLPDNEQPGVHVRMVGGKRLTDDEMVAHYATIARRLGGKAVARYRNAICLVMGEGEIYEHFGEDIASNAFYIVETPHTKRVEGFPLDRLSVRMDTGAYYYDDNKNDEADEDSQTKGFQAFFKRVMVQSNLTRTLMSQGADLVGFGSLAQLPSGVRQGLPVGVSVAVKYPKEVIRGIRDLPTAIYYEYYKLLNDRLDALVEAGAAMLREAGYTAVAQTRAYVEQHETDYQTLLPHKTVATRAGIGWIGKCALLVTKEYGSMVRISSIMTNAPFSLSAPVNESKCGDCTACTSACPAGAVSGKLWHVGLAREEFFDATACRKVARERAMRGFGVEITQCGKCIEVCPWTRRYLSEEDVEA